MSSTQSPLHKFVHQRLREIFGEPDTRLGRDDHWGLRPSPFQASINVLVDGTAENPAVWVFDPHVPNDGVQRKSINKEADLDELIQQIQEQIRKAAEKGKRSGGA